MFRFNLNHLYVFMQTHSKAGRMEKLLQLGFAILGIYDFGINSILHFAKVSALVARL